MKSGETYDKFEQYMAGNVSEWNGGYLDLFRNFELRNFNMKVRGHKRKRPGKYIALIQAAVWF